MEPKHMMMSALGLGLGVGVGLGLAGGSNVGKWAATAHASVFTADKVADELMRLVVDGRETNVTFDEFPYYLSEQTRAVLTSAAFVHLKQADFSKYTRNLPPASRAILLSGLTEPYQQTLAKALAHYFEAKLLLLDTTDFILKIQSKYVFANKDSVFQRSISESMLEGLTSIFGSFSMLPQKEEPKGLLRRQTSGVDLTSKGLEGDGRMKLLRRNASASANMDNMSSVTTTNQFPPVTLKHAGSCWPFDDKILIQSLYKVLMSISKSNPIVLYIRDVEGLLLRSQKIHSMFQKMLEKLSGPVLILGSRIVESDSDHEEVGDRPSTLFPYVVEIKRPLDETSLVGWKSQVVEDIKMMQYQDNKNHIKEVLVANDLDCDDLGSICLADTMVLGKHIEEIVVSAISYHLMHNKSPDYRNGKLVISSESLAHGLSIFQESKVEDKEALKLEANTHSTKDENVSKEDTSKSEGSSESKTEIEKSYAVTKNETGSIPPKVPIGFANLAGPIYTDVDTHIAQKLKHMGRGYLNCILRL